LAVTLSGVVSIGVADTALRKPVIVVARIEKSMMMVGVVWIYSRDWAEYASCFSYG
jgi:hypothetical protein